MALTVPHCSAAWLLWVARYQPRYQPLLLSRISALFPFFLHLELSSPSSSQTYHLILYLSRI